MEKIYIGECEHLIRNCCIADDECLKRYVTIFNPKKSQTEVLVFCNDYLKLQAQKKDENHSYSHHTYGVVDVIQSEIYKYLNFTFYHYRNFDNSLSSHRFYVTICKRPYTWKQFTFKEYIDLYFENQKNSHLKDVCKQLNLYLEKVSFKKYKTRYKDIISLSNRIQKNFYSSEETNSLLLELVNKTFELTIKNQ